MFLFDLPAFEGGETRGSVAKALGPTEVAGIRDLVAAGVPSTVFIVAGAGDLVARCLARLRTELAERLGLVLPTSLCSAQIARLAAVSPSTARRLYERGLAALRERLGATCPRKTD